MRGLLRRIEKLEKRLLQEPILLEMPNGSTETILADPNYFLDLMMRSLDGEQVPEMEVIARSIRSAEPGGGHLVDAARLLWGARRRQQPGEDELERSQL